jgi:hypothetical protein
MNKISKMYRNIILGIASLFVLAVSFAQDKGVDIDVNLKKESQWYQQPWVWIVGGAVFILLLVALLRSGRRDE